jgi:hypothetical protein
VARWKGTGHLSTSPDSTGHKWISCKDAVLVRFRGSSATGTIPAAAVSAVLAALLLALDFGFCEWGLTLRALGGTETLIIHSCFAPGAAFG